MRLSSRWLLACLTIGVTACEPLEPMPGPADDACALPDAAPSAPTTLCTLDSAAILPAHDAATRVRVGLFITVPHDGGEPRRAFRRGDAEALARGTLARTHAIYAACDIALELLVAEVLLVPPQMQTIAGNVADSWGGEAPAEEADADLFNHARDERLAAEPRALFASRSALPDGALGIFVVDDIIYHAAQKPKPAGGLSFAPVVFHNAGDFPQRNAVLAAAAYAGSGEIPAAISGRMIAHELGHMLLDTGVHVSDENQGAQDNLMLEGDELVEGQCAIMRDNIARLYGESPLIDPLDP